METIGFRRRILDTDKALVDSIIRSTGFFREDEIAVAVELVEERLCKGAESGYEFIFAELNGKTIGYSCFGLIPCTLHSFDLYWIAIHKEYMGRGIGKLLIKETETDIRELGGQGIYVETSSRELYTPTRVFYEKNGYSQKATFENFYDNGDHKVVYVKYIEPG